MQSAQKLVRFRSGVRVGDQRDCSRVFSLFLFLALQQQSEVTPRQITCRTRGSHFPLNYNTWDVYFLDVTIICFMFSKNNVFSGDTHSALECVYLKGTCVVETVLNCPPGEHLELFHHTWALLSFLWTDLFLPQTRVFLYLLELVLRWT